MNVSLKINEAVELILQEKYEEYIEFIINADSWTRERYEMFTDENTTYSVEEMIQISEEIESKAGKVGADIDDDTREDFQEFMFFWKQRSKASYTMTANALDACKESPDAPIAFIIGAAHTAKISELLRDNHSAYAVITPNSLNEVNDTSRLDFDAYERKCEGLSVGRAGTLGSLLDGRPKDPNNILKPPKVLDEPRFRIESLLRYGGELIARSAGEPDFPQEELKEELAKLEYVKIDPASITIDDDDDSVVFTAIVFDDEPIYCRVSLVKEEDELDLEDLENLLRDALFDVKATSYSEDVEVETEARPTLMEITPGRPAVFSKDSEAIRKFKLNAA